ncbi:MAG: DUF4384 domain-containing protein [Gammaproteobacteria bacterium]|jgi:Domain of unknown function (DUF4384)|nr:DUF4384 domain-containing protein [Gammaproteobacteria bacterium]
MRRSDNFHNRSLIGSLLFVLACIAAVVQAAAPTQQHSPQQSVNIDITTHLGDQQVFLEHDVISFFISLDQGAYLYMFYQDATGKLFQLMPGKAQSKHFFMAGNYIPFPAPESPFKFVVQAPFGEEQLWVFASDQGQLEFKGYAAAQGIKQLELDYAKLAEYIKSASPRLYGKARLAIQTRGR